MKTSPLRKKSKSDIKKVQDKLWEECKRIIKIRYGDVCYTCGKTVTGSNRHTGHMFAKASVGAYLKYDLRILRPQCYFCNINCGGQGAIFIENMRRIEGDDYVDTILRDRNVTVKAQEYYEKLLDVYKDINE